MLFMSCVCHDHAFLSVHYGLMVMCWERTDLLALVCDVLVFLSLFLVVFWVRCGT